MQYMAGVLNHGSILHNMFTQSCCKNQSSKIWCQFHQHFTRVCHKSAKKTLSFFAHLGSESVKAVHKMLMKLTSGPDFPKNIARMF